MGHSNETTAQRGPLGFTVIGVFKLMSGLALAGVGFGIFRLLNKDLGQSLELFILRLRLDPGNRFLHEAISRVSGIDRAHLKAIGAGTFVYAGLHILEGVGLILRRLWAGYLTVLITGSLVPLEAYEVWKKPGAVRILVLLINVGFVVYIVIKLREERRAMRLTTAGAGG